MKFKAQLNRNNVRAFRGLIQALEKVSTTCILRFNPKEMKFATISGISDVRAFATIPHSDAAEMEDEEEEEEAGGSSKVFISMMVESRADNHIWIEIELQTFLRGLKSTTGVSSQGLTMKLVKKNGLKCLTLTMKNVDAVVTQDIPIRTLTPNEGARHMKEPDEISMDVELRMPSLKTVKLVTDRMKSVDRFITLDTRVANLADGGCSMTLCVGTTQASVKTYFRNLEASPASDLQHAKRARVKLDIKKFSKILWVHQIYPKDAWLLISESSMIVLYVILDDSRTNMLYYLPVLSGGDDEEKEEDEDEGS